MSKIDLRSQKYVVRTAEVFIFKINTLTFHLLFKFYFSVELIIKKKYDKNNSNMNLN